jgi:hypothetical protein
VAVQAVVIDTYAASAQTLQRTQGYCRWLMERS